MLSQKEFSYSLKQMGCQENSNFLDCTYDENSQVFKDKMGKNNSSPTNV